VTPESESCSSSNSELVDAVATHNVSRTVEDIRTRSEIIRDLEARGEVRLVGAMYDLSTGVVTFIE
jgi:carbonic anhydrase